MYFFISSFSPSSSLIYFLSHPLPLSTLSISLSFSFSLSISLLPPKLLYYSRFANIGLVQTVLFGCSSQFAEFPQCQSPQIYVYVGIKDTLNAKPLKTIQKLQGGRSYKTKDMHFRLFNSIYRLQIMYPFLLYDGNLLTPFLYLPTEQVVKNIFKQNYTYYLPIKPNCIRKVILHKTPLGITWVLLLIEQPGKS